MRCYTSNESVQSGIQLSKVGEFTGVQVNYGVVPVSLVWLRKVRALDLSVDLDKTPPLLISADFDEQGDIIGVPFSYPGNKALVFATAPFNEKCTFTSVAFHEVKDSWGRVKREYLPLDQAAGVEIVAQTEKNVLMVLSGGAMYRVQYYGDRGAEKNLQFQWRDQARPKAELVLVNERRRERDVVSAMLEQLGN